MAVIWRRWKSASIKSRIILFYLLIAVLPLVSIDLIWFNYSQNQQKHAAVREQSVLVAESGKRLNQILSDKITVLTTVSQEQSLVNQDNAQAQISLLEYASQDSDINQITYADQTGKVLVAIKNGTVQQSAQANIANTDPFNVIKFVSNEAYVGRVSVVDNKPMVTMAVPIYAFSHLGDQNLTQAQAVARRFGSDSRGALVVSLNLSNSFQSIVNNKLGRDGYVYVVDDQGGVIAYPQQVSSRVTSGSVVHATEVQQALKLLQKNAYDPSAAKNYEPAPNVTQSENGVKVLSSHYPIGATGWAIIGEEPTSSVYAAAQRVSITALLILLFSVPLSFALIIVAARNIIRPIKDLTLGATRIGGGDFSYKIESHGNDEVGTLGQTFNAMGTSLKYLVEELQHQNVHLKAEKSKLKAVLDTINDGIIVVDKNHQIVLLNNEAAKTIELPNPEDSYGKAWLEIFELVAENGERVTDEQLAAASTNLENLSLQVNGKKKYLNLNATKLENDPNGIDYMITLHDITQSRELEVMKLDFVSMAAHELRTPLTAIRGYLELMLSPHSGDMDRKMFLERAAGAATMLGKLINNMLSLSRIERKSMKLNIVRLDWGAVVESEVSNHQFTAKDKSITLVVNLPSQPLFVMGDELALREVLGNFISNAIHYTKQGGSITVSVEVLTEDSVKTTVSDTGIGIPPDALHKLFTKYYRAKGGLTTNSQGTGIGLFISKNIIESHYGTVGVNSTLGKGSDFYFTLPQAQHSSYEVPVSKAPQEESQVVWF